MCSFTLKHAITLALQRENKGAQPTVLHCDGHNLGLHLCDFFLSQAVDYLWDQCPPCFFPSTWQCGSSCIHVFIPRLVHAHLFPKWKRELKKKEQEKFNQIQEANLLGNTIFQLIW